MQITRNSWAVYYGNDAFKLTQQQDLLKKQGYIFFKGDFKDLYNECFSNNLFNLNSSLIVDSSLIPPLDFEKIINKGISNKKNLVYFYSGNDIKSTFLKMFYKSYKYTLLDDKKIFKFLDDLFKNNLASSLAFLTKFVKDEEKIYLLNMIFYTIKNISLYYYDPNSYKNLNFYVQIKTKQLSSIINRHTTKSLLNLLSEADYKIKISNDKDSVIFSTVFYLASIK